MRSSRRLVGDFRCPYTPFARPLISRRRSGASRRACIADPRACDSVARVSVDSLVILLSAFVAGMINSVAGGGTLVSFPALLWVGRDPIVANVTSTIGLWPASLGAMVGFRRELRESREWISVLLAPSFAGGILGAMLLLRTPSRTFAAIVPYLILFATSLFAAGDRAA